MTPPKQVVAPLSSEQRDELRTLLEAATPGPWFRETEDIIPGGPYEDKWSEVSAPDGKVATVGYADSDWRQDSQNAALIAAMHEALPSLLQASEERDALLVKVEAIRDICNREIELEKRGSVYARVAKEILALDNPQEVTPDA